MTKKAEIAQFEDALVERCEQVKKLHKSLERARKLCLSPVVVARTERKISTLTREKDEIRERLMVLYREGLDDK